MDDLFRMPALDRKSIAEIEKTIRDEAVYDGEWTADELRTVNRVFWRFYDKIDEMFEEKLQKIRQMKGAENDAV